MENFTINFCGKVQLGQCPLGQSPHGGNYFQWEQMKAATYVAYNRIPCMSAY